MRQPDTTKKLYAVLSWLLEGPASNTALNLAASQRLLSDNHHKVHGSDNSNSSSSVCITGLCGVPAVTALCSSLASSSTASSSRNQAHPHLELGPLCQHADAVCPLGAGIGVSHHLHVLCDVGFALAPAVRPVPLKLGRRQVAEHLRERKSSALDGLNAPPLSGGGAAVMRVLQPQ
eukprot:GHRQ01034007.1.p1 GENE.GHRQ01034007.1~~GHRQ01034007.1.p1  ORF type:complete len:176 (-),score=6.35 GHRQ01034007.1:487-1014(-)